MNEDQQAAGPQPGSEASRPDRGETNRTGTPASSSPAEQAVSNQEEALESGEESPG